MEYTKSAVATEAAARFLSRRGYEIIEMHSELRSDNEPAIVASDGTTIVFAEAVMNDWPGADPFDEPRMSRKRFERIAATWLRTHHAWEDGEDKMVRFDVLSMHKLSEDRLFLRHHLGALCDDPR